MRKDIPAPAPVPQWAEHQAALAAMLFWLMPVLELLKKNQMNEAPRKPAKRHRKKARAVMKGEGNTHAI